MNASTEYIRQKMEALDCVLSLLYVPCHKEVPGNELEYRLEKAATNLPWRYSDNNVSMKAAKSIVRRHTKDPPSTHNTINHTYKGIFLAKDRA